MGTAVTHEEQDSLASRRLPYLLKPILAKQRVDVMGRCRAVTWFMLYV